MARTTAQHRTCESFRRHAAINRRGLLRLGMLGAGGLTLPHVLASQAAAFKAAA